MSTSEHNLVLILARGLASSIATPLFVVDENGTLVYYNEPAEEILGMTFAEAGEMSPQEWASMFYPEDPQTGDKLSPDQVPLSIALAERRPVHRNVVITGGDEVRRTIAVTAFPLFARTDEFVGALAIFWEEGEA
jgi:PAS domain-containing protein